LRYRIYGDTISGPTIKIDSTTGGINDTSKTITGLTNGTRYYFHVTAVDNTGNESDSSNEVNATPIDIIAPASPQNLVATDSSSQTITIKWQRNTEVDFMLYRIYGDTIPNPTTKVDSTTGGIADTSKTFAGLANGTRYYFRVTAVDSVNNESGYSNEVSSVPADRIAPAAPQNLVVTDSSSQTITINWQRNTEADFMLYLIYRDTIPNPTIEVDSTTGGIADTSKTFIGLTDGRRYYLRVTAIDSAGNESGYSNEVSAMPIDLIAPDAPQNLVVADSLSETITIKWRGNTEPDFLRYLIYRDTLPNPVTRVDSTAGGIGDTSKTFTGLTNGTRYYFRITAVDSSRNESDYSNEVNAVPNVPVTVEESPNNIVKEYSLAQNYPNPFNPATVIKYQLPAASSVRLIVYDILGREVATLVDEIKEAGYYTATFDGSRLASGIYFNRIVAQPQKGGQPFVQVKKMLLTK
jgi:fibronectin type 3 domain-containing protein